MRRLSIEQGLFGIEIDGSAVLEILTIATDAALPGRLAATWQPVVKPLGSVRVRRRNGDFPHAAVRFTKALTVLAFLRRGEP